MTTNASARAKGAKWERDVADWLGAERRRLTSRADTGDLAGLPGVIVECKAHGRLQLADWVKQLDEEVAAAPGTKLGLLAVKRSGKTSPEDGYWLVHSRHVPWLVQSAVTLSVTSASSSTNANVVVTPETYVWNLPVESAAEAPG